MSKTETTEFHIANPFAQEPLQQLLMLISRELYENMKRNGWTPEEAKNTAIKTVKAGLKMRKP